ncbi:MAG: class I SAM-dependent methyltransferase [Bacteroidetes bacterium]|nr:class I SAM-dependent methyltransferase [Bacteroidota bacterium]
MERKEKVLINFFCQICNNEENNSFYTVREMQFGTRDKFNYCECSKCGCLQLVNPPNDMSEYYPKNYFSFQKQKISSLKESLNIFRDKHVLGKKNLIGNILYKIYGAPTYTNWLINADVNFKSEILDVGCGAGELLYRMGNAGFKNAMGIDLFIDNNIHYKNDVHILKKSLFEIDSQFDFVMMHHSLEHMQDQHKVFKKIYSILKPKKTLLIRIPICSCFAWKNYRENWFALEAPRHFFIHSEKSIELLAEKHGFKIKSISYDSRNIQFWASIQYQKDIPLMDEKSYFINPKSSIFSDKEIKEFEKETKLLNENGGADLAVIYLERID